MIHLDIHSLAYIGLTLIGFGSSVDWLSLIPRGLFSRKARGQKGAGRKGAGRMGAGRSPARGLRRKLPLRKDRRLIAYCCAMLLILVWLSEALAPSDGAAFDWPEFSLTSVSGFFMGALGGAAITSALPAKACFVTRVIDGDTVALDCNGQSERGRLIGIDTPELKGRCAREIRAANAAKSYLAKALARAKVVEVVEKKGRDKYGRRLIWLKLDGEDAAKRLIAAGHGRAYDGGLRRGWC